MTHRTPPGRPAHPLALPVFARMAPALPPEILAARIGALSATDDVVVDPFGRGGWVARTALAMGRRAVSIETSPLTRLLADVVVRAPDLRHLDAAFQAVAAAPVGTTSLRATIDGRFATRCPTCGRSLALDELTWEPGDGGSVRPVRRSFRCPACLDRRGRGGELRHSAPEAGDLELAEAGPVDPAVREEVARRFPVEAETGGLVDALLDLHSARQLEALAAILSRIESDLRASQVTSALRLAFLHAILPSSRLNTHAGRPSSLRIAEGAIRPPASPGLAGAQPVARVRGRLSPCPGLRPGAGRRAVRRGPGAPRGLPGCRPGRTADGLAPRRRRGRVRPAGVRGGWADGGAALARPPRPRPAAAGLDAGAPRGGPRPHELDARGRGRPPPADRSVAGGGERAARPGRGPRPWARGAGAGDGCRRRVHAAPRSRGRRRPRRRLARRRGGRVAGPGRQADRARGEAGRHPRARAPRGPPRTRTANAGQPFAAAGAGRRRRSRGRHDRRRVRRPRPDRRQVLRGGAEPRRHGDGRRRAPGAGRAGRAAPHRR